MPEVKEAATGSRLFKSSVEAVEKFLEELTSSLVSLTTAELQRYSKHKAIVGWKLVFEKGAEHFQLEVFCDRNFPRTFPRIAWRDSPPLLTHPHVEENGLLCLFPEIAEVDPYQPTQVLREALSEAIALIEDLTEGRRTNDFREEFNSYWDRSISKDARPVYCLLNLSGTSRPIRAWHGKSLIVVGDDDLSINAWLDNCGVKKTSADRAIRSALFIRLDRPMLPNEYPKKVDDIRSIVHQAGFATEFNQLFNIQTKSALVILGAPVSSGTCIAGVTVNASAENSGKICDGFRPGKIPKELYVRRALNQSSITRHTTERIDSDWIHGRGKDGRIKPLRESKVTILGCGSLGASLAVLLAKAGIGYFNLVDPQRLAWANVGRHPLGGVENVGEFKAEALKRTIQRSHPEITNVQSFVARAEDLITDEDFITEMTSSSLVIGAIGHWGVEGTLNEWWLTSGRRVPMIFTWIEPYGLAGHALLLGDSGGCLQCGFDPTGRQLFRVTDWRAGSTIQYEPGCGAIFQPYGPVELSNVVTLTAELALDCLLLSDLKPTHRIWATKYSQIIGRGGDLTPEWEIIKDRLGDRTIVEEREWLLNPGCPECRCKTM